MADLEKPPMITASAAVDGTPPAAPRSPAAALIDEGDALREQGRIAEAVARYQQAIALDPQCADAFVGMANAFVSLERPHEAATSLRWAIGLRPDYALAHRLLGTALSSLGDLDAAEASLRRAQVLEPESAEIPNDLAMILQQRGKYAEAAQLLARALERATNWTAKAAFANCAAHAQFTADDSPVRAALTAAITEAWGNPHELCWSAFSLIRLDERIASCVRLANDSWPARPPRVTLFGAGGLAALAADRLLHALLDAAPVRSIHFERFLTCARHALLEIGSSEQPPAPADVMALSFYAALTRQCFINEFVFDCPDEEQLAMASCRSRLLALLDAKAAVPPFLVLAVAAYYPLHLLREADRLLATSQPGPVDEVLSQQIREPLQEQALRAGVKRLSPITDSVSQGVRDQYEQSPYPRWVKMPISEPPLHFNAELRRVLPFARFAPMSDDSAPEVLVAGCGTGGDAILVAGRFRGARVLAIDLSLGSLSYAKRKTLERDLPNIEYVQADILELGDIARTFDIIGAVGVLHHLADPFKGWRILLSRLRPGGFMCLGLYSQIARRPVVKAREFIAARGYACTPDGIRKFRQDAVAENTSAEVRSLSRSRAFYSMSDCRDLAFHVQEQHLTLPQIESFVSESGLRFIGFELDRRVLDQYRARFGNDPSCSDLRNWARFEADNPDTFTAMYQFWIRK
jgi:SAM-dependent methyltransferase/tetratricopeptide (TPR) repeat protein